MFIKIRSAWGRVEGQLLGTPKVAAGNVAHIQDLHHLLNVSARAHWQDTFRQFAYPEFAPHYEEIRAAYHEAHSH